MRQRIATSSVVLGGCLAGFAVLFALVKADRTRAVDLALTLRLQARRSPALATAMRYASWPGFPPQSRAIPPLVIGAWLLAGRPAAAVCQALAWGGALASTIAKALVRRDRPVAPEVAVVLAPLGGTSFPSGHVLTYTTFYGFLAYLVARLGRPAPVRRVIAGGLVGLVAMVGPSRVQQGHHWPTDVLASYLLGVAYLLGLVRLYETLAARADSSACDGGAPATPR